MNKNELYGEGLNEDLNESLIHLVQQYPILYNKKAKLYRNHHKKSKVWEEIASEISIISKHPTKGKN